MEFLSTSFGPAAHEANKTSSAVVLGLAATTFGFLFRAWKTQPGQRIRISGMAFFHLSWILLTLGVATGRSGIGPGYAGLPRYETLTFGILCGIYLITIIYGPGILRWLIPTGLLLMTLLALPPNIEAGLQYACRRQHSYARFLDDLRANAPVELLAARNTEVIYPVYGPHVLDFIRILQDYKIGPFSEATIPSVPQHFPCDSELELSPVIVHVK